jgi:hypothetical protein
MRNKWCVLFAASFVGVLLSSRAEAGSITITDLTDGPPVVVVTGLESPVFTTLPEFADVSGLLRPATSPAPLTVGTRWVLLTEPVGDPFGPAVSDIVRLVASAIQIDAQGQFQIETVTFWSDGAVGFDDALRLATAAGAPSVLEIDAPQDITALLGIGFPNQNLQVIARSDVGGAEPVPVPEPTTLSLVAFGIGLSAKRLRRVRR